MAPKLIMTWRPLVRRLFGLFMLLGAASAAHSNTLTACASNTPPFVLTANGKGVGGFSVELLREVAATMKRDVDVLELPWARCLNEVRAGRVDVAIDAYDDSERRKVFLYSDPYYTLTPQVFFSARNPEPVAAAKSAAELGVFKGCGVREYTYEHYGLDETTMERGAANSLQMLRMLLGGRCDFAVEEIEFIIGQRRHASQWLDETDLRSFQPVWAQGPRLHWLVGLQHPNAKALVNRLNEGLALIDRSGTVAKLRVKHLTEPMRQQ